MSKLKIEFDDRYQALGIPYPDEKTCCQGDCEGTGLVPIDIRDETDPVYIRLWNETEVKNPNEPGDNWHFVTCPRCNGTRKEPKEAN